MSGADTPVLTVVRGELDEVELAALVAVLTASRARRRDGGGSATPRRPKWRAPRFSGPRGWAVSTTIRPGQAVRHSVQEVRV